MHLTLNLEGLSTAWQRGVHGWAWYVALIFLLSINTLFTARPIIGSLTFVMTFALRRKKQLRHLSKNTAISSQHRSLLDNI